MYNLMQAELFADDFNQFHFANILFLEAHWKFRAGVHSWHKIKVTLGRKQGLNNNKTGQLSSFKLSDLSEW